MWLGVSNHLTDQNWKLRFLQLNHLVSSTKKKKKKPGWTPGVRLSLCPLVVGFISDSPAECFLSVLFTPSRAVTLHGSKDVKPCSCTFIWPQALLQHFIQRNKEQNVHVSPADDTWNKREQKNNKVHTYSCVNTSSHKPALPPYQLWRCSGAGCCQRFPHNNVTRRGIPVRPRKGRGSAQTERAGCRHLNRLWQPPGDPSPSLPPSVCVGGGRNVTWPASRWLPNSSLAGWGRLRGACLFFFFF